MKSTLFSPFKIRQLTLKNRIIVSPMCMYSAENGIANNWHLVHLGARAIGGAAMIIVEATGVSPEGRISPGCLGLWSDEQMKALTPIASFIKQQGCVPSIQLAHAGRKASAALGWHGGHALTAENGGWETVAPSALPYSKETATPKELSTKEIEHLISHFETATQRALHAGFEVIELHMAHGYLMHQFLSPLTNKRTDEFGGKLENRIRFPLKVAAAVRKIIPAQLPLFVRISASDWTDGGWDLSQSIILCHELKKIGVDLIDCSSGGLVPQQKIPLGPAYQVHFSEAIRKEVQIPTGAVGLITDPEEAEGILNSGKADFILLGRELLRNPQWPLHAAKKLGVDIPWPVQYERART